MIRNISGRSCGIASLALGLVNLVATLLFCGALIFSSLFRFGVITSPDEFLTIVGDGAIKQNAECYENEEDIGYVESTLTLPDVTRVEKKALPNDVKDFVNTFTEEWMFPGYLVVFGLAGIDIFLADTAKKKGYNTKVSQAGMIFGVSELCINVLCAIVYFAALL